MLSTPACVSFRSSKRPSSSGPISETVARTGCPCSPNTSQNTTGQASPVKSSILSSFARSIDLRIVRAGLAQAGEIAFDVGHENRHATGTKIFRERLQGDCFSRAGGAGDQAVAVRHFRQQKNRLRGLRDEDGFVRHRMEGGVND